MRITEFSIKRPITIFMGIIAVLIFGAVSYTRLNLDMLPKIDLPMIIVNTRELGTGPSDIEENITKPLEEVLSTVSNVKKISSVSEEGNSTVMIQFEDGTDMDFASLEIREKIDLIKSAFKDGVKEPMIMRLNPSMMPVMNFGVSFKGYDEGEISKWATKVLKPSLERIDGVAAVSISGGVEDQIKIVIDNDKLTSYGLSVQSIATSVKGEDLNFPIGNIIEGDNEILVRTNNKVNSLKDIENILLKTKNGEVIKLSSIAKIEETNANSESFSKINGVDALAVNIQKESTSNVVNVNKEVNKELEKLKKSNEGLEVIKIIDQGEIIEFMISSVKQNAVVGALLAILVLLFFLKDFRTTIIMGVSIPISIIATFVMVYFGGLTLNMISLGGIALGVGMLVDNSIVVIESIYRLKKLGYSNKDAAITGTKEVSKAITASTITSICVFLPIVFVQGIAADIFKEMALTVTFSLVSSLAVSFTLVPILASKLLNDKSLNKENKLVKRLTEKYGKLLKVSLGRRKVVIFVMIVFIMIGAITLKYIGIEFFPSSDQGVIMINATLPNGSSTSYSEGIGDNIVEKLKDIEEIESDAIIANKEGCNIYLVLKGKDERNRSDKEIAREVNKLISKVPGAKIEVNTSNAGLSTGGDPIQINIIGREFEVLDEIAEDVIKEVNKVNGTINVKSSNVKNSEELRLVINKELAADYGLNSMMISQSLQSYFKEVNITTVKFDDKNYDVLISPESSINPKLSDLDKITLINNTGAKVPLMTIAKLERGEGYSKIYREDGTREVTISSGVSGRALKDVVDDIKDNLEGYDVKSGYSIQYSGEVQEMEEAFSQLLLALILAVILVYMVMASQFESLINPFIIMFTVPLASVGAIIMLFITEVNLSIPAMIGFVMLTGIIVNNGIVLIDYINQKRKEGMNATDAIIFSGKVRLRPILMTALTTIIGLLPMALGTGEGAEIQLPLAITVIGGLTIGTALTLVVIPVIYSLFDDLQRKLKK
ncbi:efflux RND transporter permease subunit [Clostridium sp.]|uniref:efflux RND transporter permease subunit n=1 Tax=Clostridium sp. TaxID=1506 RepID=UPI002FCC376B